MGPRRQPRIERPRSSDGWRQITSGRASIVVADGKRKLTFAPSFWTRAAPDLYVYLVPGTGRGGEINGGFRLARLDAVDGPQQYTIPKNVEVEPPFAVVIWCDLCEQGLGARAVHVSPAAGPGTIHASSGIESG